MQSSGLSGFSFITGRTEVAELLIERGADVNAHENYHICPLHWACGRGHTEIARMLLRKGVKVNVGDKVRFKVGSSQEHLNCLCTHISD